MISRGGTQYKRPYRDILPTWVANQPLVYEWSFIKCKFWYELFLISQHFPKLDKIGSKLKKIFKTGWFCSKFCQIFGQLVYEWVHFSWKISICMGLLSNSAIERPYKTSSTPGVYCPKNLDIDKFQDSTVRYCLLTPILGVLEWSFPFGLVNFATEKLTSKLPIFDN